MSSNNEWYTPAKYIEAAREVMGAIDLDPASCEMANKVVQAKHYYTREDNGLMQPWHGRIYAAGNVEQAVLLSLGNPNSVWFQPFFDFTLCFYRGHIDFYRPDGSTGTFGFPLAFVYLGPNESRFIEVFSRFGRVVKAIDTPKPKPIMLDLWQTAAS